MFISSNGEKSNWINFYSCRCMSIATMFFDYVYMQQGSAWDYSTENVEVIPVSVHGMKGQMFLTDDWEHEWNTITWIDAQNNIQFSIDGNFDADDILHIAESVSLVNSTK